MTNRDKKDSIRGRMADTGEPFNVARRRTAPGGGFFAGVPAAEPGPPRRHQPWELPEAELPGIVPVDTLLLGRTDQVAVALTGMSAFSAGGGPHSFVSRWWTWPLPPAGPLEFVCEWPAFGIAESRAVIDAQLILGAAARSIQLWSENEG